MEEKEEEKTKEAFRIIFVELARHDFAHNIKEEKEEEKAKEVSRIHTYLSN